MGRRRLWIAFLQLALAASASAQFDVLSWTFDPGSHPGSLGNVTADTMFIKGPDGSPGCFGTGATAAFTATAPVSGAVSVKLHFETDTKFGFPDQAVAIVDGIATQMMSSSDVSAEFALAVQAGSVFGFGVHSIDCEAGSGLLTVTEFRFHVAADQTVATGSTGGERFGAALANVGDLDGDTIDDVLVGAPFAAVAGTATGRAMVLSGVGLALLHEFAGAASGEEFGAAVAGAGDVDADGVPDLLVGAPRFDVPAPLATDAGCVRVLSGASGSLLHELQGVHAFDRLGSAVCAVGDVDRDGHADFAVGVPFDDWAGSNAGRVLVLSGADGSPLATYVGMAAGERFGAALAPLGDVGEGHASELVVGAPYADALGLERGRVDLISLTTGARRSFSGTTDFEHLGSSLADAGDADGDGQRDVVAGAPDFGTVSGFREGRAVVISGADLVLLHEFTGDGPNDRLGFAVHGAGDLDGDGASDVLVGVPQLGPPNPQTGAVRACSGQTGELLHVLQGAQSTSQFGSAIARLSGTRVVIGAPGADAAGVDAGAATAATIHVTWSDLGQGLAGATGVPTLAGQGLLAAGTLTKLEVNGKPVAPLILVLGLSAQNAPFKGGTLVPALDLVLVGASTDHVGQWLLQAAWPAGVPGGVALYLQAWIVDAAGPAGLAATNALRAVTS